MDNLLNKIIIFFKRGKNKVQASVENKNKILAKNSRQKNKKRPVRSYVTLVVFFAFIFLLLDITALILYFIYGKGLVYFLNLFILLILMECIILLYYSLLIRQRRRRLNRRLIRLKKLKHIYRELKEFCYDNNLHFKKMPWYLIIEETESDKSHLFNCDRHQLFKRISQNLSVWTTNDYIAINIKNMITIGGDVKSTYHSRYFELLLEILNKYKENPINGILIMTDSNSLFKLPSALIKSYSKAIVRNINYLYTYCKNIIPIYFIIEKSAELVGFEEFFSKVHIHSSIKETLGYTSDKLIDSSDLNYGGDLINGIEKFINYIEHNRDELLYTAFDSDSCNRRMDYIDSFYQFSFNLKSLLNNLKIAIEICAAESNELNSPFPARGVYFITKSNGIQSSKFINQNSQDTEHNNLENAQNVENYKIEFSLANIFEKVISTESKTVLPMFKNYYIKRRRKRLVFIFLTLCFLFLCYTSYNQYSTFDSQMKKLYGVWSPAKDGRNWYSYRRFKPCISYTYNVRNLGNTKKTKSIVDNATNKNSKESLTKGVEEKDSLFIASIDPRVKLASGESLYSFLNSLILTGDNRINYPSFFYLYQFLPMFNLKEHEMVSLRSIFLTSFIYPLLESSYGTFLFTEDVKWNKTTFVNLIVLVKLLSYLDDTYTNKSLFIENLKVRDYYTFTIGILDFLYKYRNTSVGVAEKKITYEDAAKLSATMAEKSSIINNFLYPECTAPLDYMMERRI
ncbi:MAG: hypothetical protein GY756_00810, partial [bacterium]|nr:hypothetical protein [bacterium]